MKSKKLIAMIACATLVLPLAACGSKAVAPNSGGKITEEASYNEMQTTTNGQKAVQHKNM